MPESNVPAGGMDGIDPSVNEYLDQVAEDMTGGTQPSKTFGDDAKVEKSDLEKLPGETPVEAHIRLQRERANQDGSGN